MRKTLALERSLKFPKSKVQSPNTLERSPKFLEGTS